MEPDFHFDTASSKEEYKSKEDLYFHSQWDFASYSMSAAEEQPDRNTTSVDAKITRALRDCPVVSLPALDETKEEEEDENGDDEEWQRRTRSSTVRIRVWL
ncbi:DEAD-box ATP-dependent RNA helicase 28 [Iris pallida]|uniref:DEAD-box ATP-dependent RNA helicase 28 n=1 Tax=Iris pallida TaxID=29817 RepID=A0AAX6ECB2_IRIPA|nr:DEAD-box ATP-dependent RNA helicase 28 [Iris pallida]